VSADNEMSASKPSLKTDAACENVKYMFRDNVFAISGFAQLSLKWLHSVTDQDLGRLATVFEIQSVYVGGVV